MLILCKEPSSFIFGPMKTSEPILDRIAQLEFEEEKYDTMEMAQLVVRLRHDLNSFELFQTGCFGETKRIAEMNRLKLRIMRKSLNGTVKNFQ